MTVYLADSDFTLYLGDAREVLQELPDESAHCVVTSPPYYGLRDYGVEGQLGLEPTPEEYVANLVEVFREVRRVLRRDGVCWLVIGDSYNAAGRDSHGTRIGVKQGTNRASAAGLDVNRPNDPGLKPKDIIGIPWRLAFALQADGWFLRSEVIWDKPNAMPESVTDRPSKSHEQVFLLTKSARYFYDQEAVREPWTTDHMPGAKTNETYHYGAGNGGNTGLTAHRQPFMDELRRQRHRVQKETLDGSEGEAPRGPDGRRKTHVVKGNASIQHRDGERWPGTGRNLRSVWQIVTQPYPGAHFAVFPEELADRCVKAGSSERGCCPECGVPWQRVLRCGDLRPVSGEYLSPLRGDYKRDGTSEVIHQAGNSMVRTTDGWKFLKRDRLLDGWRPGCACYDWRYYDDFPAPKSRWQQTTWWGRVKQRPIPVEFGWPVEPCVVLDPFVGAGTVPLVARRLGRRAVAIELSEASCKLTADRTRQLSLFG